MAATVLALAGCSGDDDPGDSTPVITDPVETTDSTTSTSSTTSTTVDPDAAVEAEVEEAYLAYGDAFLEIFAEPNPNNPLIAEFTTGAVRAETLDAITQDVLNGRSVRPPENPDDYKTSVLDVQVNGPEATVRACVVDGSMVIDNASGTVINDTLATLLIEATLLDEGTWKVATSQVLERREERWNCADPTSD